VRVTIFSRPYYGRAYASALRPTVVVCDAMYWGPVRGFFPHTWHW